MSATWIRFGWKTFGWVVAVLGLFLARPGIVKADMLTACNGLINALPGQHQILGFVCPTAGGGTISGDETEVDLPSLHVLHLAVTISCPIGSAGCAAQELFTGTYQTFIGPGIDSVTLDGTLNFIPPNPGPSPLTETILESGQGTTFNNNPAVVSGFNTQRVLPVSFFLTQTKEGDFNGKGVHIVGLSWNLPGGEEYILPAVGVLAVPEPPTLPLLATSCLGLLVYFRRRKRPIGSEESVNRN
jgi:hypothetical protein